MRNVFYLLLLICFQFNVCNAQTNTQVDIKFYELGLNKIRNNQESDLKRVAFNVSHEVLSFNTLGIFFKDSYPELSKRLPSFDNASNVVVVNNESLGKLGCKRSKKTKLFFTEIQDGFFFVEVLKYGSKWLNSYAERPHFGESKVFMLKVEGEDVILLNSKNINYN